MELTGKGFLWRGMSRRDALWFGSCLHTLLGHGFWQFPWYSRSLWYRVYWCLHMRYGNILHMRLYFYRCGDWAISVNRNINIRDFAWLCWGCCYSNSWIYHCWHGTHYNVAWTILKANFASAGLAIHFCGVCMFHSVVSFVCFLRNQISSTSIISLKVYTRKVTTTLTGSFLYTFPEESGLKIENIFRKEFGLSLFISLFFPFFLPQR